MHSVKNRFLMRIKNMTSGLYRKFWMPTSGRDILVIGGCLLREPKSLPAFWRVARCFRRSLAWRRKIMSRRQAAMPAWRIGSVLNRLHSPLTKSHSKWVRQSPCVTGSGAFARGHYLYFQKNKSVSRFSFLVSRFSC